MLWRADPLCPFFLPTLDFVRSVSRVEENEKNIADYLRRFNDRRHISCGVPYTGSPGAVLTAKALGASFLHERRFSNLAAEWGVPPSRAIALYPADYANVRAFTASLKLSLLPFFLHSRRQLFDAARLCRKMYRLFKAKKVKVIPPSGIT